MSIPSESSLRFSDRDCPHCGSSTPKLDEVFGYYACRDCSHVWAHDRDDPDWEDYMDDVELLSQAEVKFQYLFNKPLKSSQ